MKKLFVSVPMRGRTEENIRKSIDKMHKIAEVVFDDELEVLPSYNPANNNRPPIKALADSITILAEADYFIGTYAWGYHGCAIERDIANKYMIPSFMIDVEYIAPDIRNQTKGMVEF